MAGTWLEERSVCVFFGPKISVFGPKIRFFDIGPSFSSLAFAVGDVFPPLEAFFDFLFQSYGFFSVTRRSRSDVAE